MENASKAMFIAAGVLIGIMILSLAVYLIITFGSTSAEIAKQKQLDQINQFNSQFTVYDGRKNLTIHEVITLANLATQSNINYDLDSSARGDKASMYVAVFVNGIGYLDQGIETTNLNHYTNNIRQDILKISQNNELQKYTAKVSVSQTTGMVYFITISKL